MEKKPVPTEWKDFYDTHFMYQVSDLYNPAKNGEWIETCYRNGACGYTRLEADGIVDSANFRGYSIRYLVYSDDRTSTRIIGHYRKCSDPTCGLAINESQALYANTFLHNIEPKKITRSEIDDLLNSDLFNF